MKVLEETYYVQTLEAFIRRCDQERVTLNWIGDKMPSLLKAVTWPVSTADVVRIVGVGSGNGIMDVDVIKLVRRHCPANPIHCVGIEPNPDELARFKERWADEGASDTRVTFELHEKISEDFEKILSIRPDRAYHVVHMFQMLYHVRDMEETILNYYDKLIEGGLVVITIAAKDGNALLQAFKDFEATLPYPEEELPAQNMKRYSDDVLPILRRHGILFHLETVSYTVDVSECFVTGSVAGKMLLDFICLTNATRVYQSLAGEDRSALLNSMSTYCKYGDNGEIKLTLTFDCITFYKDHPIKSHVKSTCNGIDQDM